MSNETAKQFGAALRAAREDKGLSLRCLAKLIGVSPTYLSQVEQGKTPPPTEERVVRIAHVLVQNDDFWLSEAGHIATDLREAICESPFHMPNLIRFMRAFSHEQFLMVWEALDVIVGDDDDTPGEKVN